MLSKISFLAELFLHGLWSTLFLQKMLCTVCTHKYFFFFLYQTFQTEQADQADVYPAKSSQTYKQSSKLPTYFCSHPLNKLSASESMRIVFNLQQTGVYAISSFYYYYYFMPGDTREDIKQSGKGSISDVPHVVPIRPFQLQKHLKYQPFNFSKLLYTDSVGRKVQ